MISLTSGLISSNAESELSSGSVLTGGRGICGGGVGDVGSSFGSTLIGVDVVVVVVVVVLIGGGFGVVELG